MSQCEANKSFFGTGARTATFRFSESGGSLNGPDLFPAPNPSFTDFLPLFTENPFLPLTSASSRPLPKSRLPANKAITPVTRKEGMARKRRRDENREDVLRIPPCPSRVLLQGQGLLLLLLELRPQVPATGVRKPQLPKVGRRGHKRCLGVCRPKACSTGAKQGCTGAKDSWETLSPAGQNTCCTLS